MIDVENVTFSYGSPVFQGFSWQVARGEAWSIIGPSGCGKSTLLYLIAGLRHPDSGQVRVAGEHITRPRPETGLILQDHGLLPWATVEENARLGLRIRRFYGPDGVHAPEDADRLDKQATRDRVSMWLGRLGIAEQGEKFPNQISGGQRQRTAIARTLALRPDLMLLDEPFSALDAPTREGLQNLIVELRREQDLTTLIVTHNIEEAVFLGNKILVLNQPPNRQPTVVENPAAGTEGFRSDAAFVKQTDHVRQLMDIRQ